MKYAVIDTANSYVFSAHEYTGTNWTLFKSTYESEHEDKLLVDLGASMFPSGQEWSQETDGVYPSEPKSVNDVRANVLASIQRRTNDLEYNGVVTFKGQDLPRDHDTRDDVVLMAVSCISSTELAASLLPLRVNAINTAEVTIDTVADAKDFALAMLSPTKAIYANQADQIASVNAMTTITQLITYIDPR